MDERPRVILDEADAIISDLNYWVTASDADASIRIAEGFGAALVRSASLRLSGKTVREAALSLAEQAARLSENRDPRHIGWLLLSIKLELLDLSVLNVSSSRHSLDDLLRQVDALTANLILKGMTSIATYENRCRCKG